MKTAVEWLINEMPVIDWQDPYWKIKLEKAKEMEYKQIIDARAITKTGYEIAEAEEYYFENYGKL
jgi:hypothetical protein